MGNLGETKPINKLIIEMGGDEYVFSGGSSGPLPPDSVGTEQIIDSSVQMEDLHDDVKDKMNYTYDAENEGIKLGGIMDGQE